MGDEGFLIKWVMRLSGGRITEVKDATTVLLIISFLVICLAAVIFIFQNKEYTNTPPEYRSIKSHTNPR